MLNNLIDGRIVSDKIKARIKEEVDLLKENDIFPALAVVLVGDNNASKIYVKNKEKACELVGIDSCKITLPEDTTQDKLCSIIDKLNNDIMIDGILVQLPLPEHLNEKEILNRISPKKDVDGFHSVNTGNLILGNNGFTPCTPLGIMTLLKEYNVKISGKNCVIVGRSNIVGKPMAHLLLQEDATVTICHSKTKDLKFHTKNADILIVAVGKPNFITGDMVKEGVVVIDVGINRQEGSKKLVGDVKFDEVSKKASLITPVPGGVGVMTIASLLQNTLKAMKI